MDSNTLLNWLYSYKLLAKNKKATRILYKKIAEHEDISALPIKRQKDILRTIENKEKTNPDLIVSNYEKLLIEKYHIDFEFTLSKVYDYYDTAKKLANLLSAFTETIKTHRNIPCYVLRYEIIEPLGEGISLFFKVLSGMDLITIKGNDTDSHYMSDTILHYPHIANLYSQINGLRNDICAKETIDQTFIWSIVYIEFTKKEGESNAESFNETNKRLTEALCRMIKYADTLPLKIPYYTQPMEEKDAECVMDILYANHFLAIALISHFTDKRKSNDHIYICPIWNRLKDEPFTAYFYDESRNAIIDFTRSGHGHIMRIHEPGYDTCAFFVMMKSYSYHDFTQIKGIATLHTDIEKMQRNIIDGNDLRILTFDYSYDGNDLTFYDEDEETLFASKRITRNIQQKELCKNIEKADYANDDVRRYGFAKISMDNEQIVFSFTDKETNVTIRYKIKISADPRLRQICVNDLAYLYTSPDNETFIMIEQTGHINIKDMERE